MAGIMHKIEETLNIGGHKKEEQSKGEQHHAAAGSDQHQGDQQRKGDQQHYGGEHKPEQKEGIVDKIKDKIHGDGQGKPEEGKKKKKKEKKEKKHDGHDSSSSDSDQITLLMKHRYHPDLIFLGVRYGVIERACIELDLSTKNERGIKKNPKKKSFKSFAFVCVCVFVVAIASQLYL